MVISKFDCNIQGEKSSSQHTQLCRKQWCFSTEVQHNISVHKFTRTMQQVK